MSIFILIQLAYINVRDLRSDRSVDPLESFAYVAYPVVTDIVKQYDDGDPTDDFMSFFMVPY